MDIWLDGCVDGCLDGWLEGWLGGCVGGWLDGDTMLKLRFVFLLMFATSMGYENPSLESWG